MLLSEFELEPGVKVECVSKFCYLGDTLGSGGGVVEAARARCVWAKFKELSPILNVRGASYRIKGRIYSACVQNVLIYGTETWAMKVDDLRSLERTERMMVSSGVTTVVAATAVLWGPAGLGGPGSTRINYEHSHSASMNY